MLNQKYHLLDQRIDNKMLPRIRSFFKIALFLHNMCSKRLTSNSEILYEVIETMKSQNSVENTLVNKVQQNSWQRKKLPFQTISSEVLEDFPKMTETNLQIFFAGSYQLKQAVSYLAEM
ncbi:GSCOCG00010878001-RA-CDS, partial [Cotesia congregata]